jgi:hypothetical protein
MRLALRTLRRLTISSMKPGQIGEIGRAPHQQRVLDGA